MEFVYILGGSVVCAGIDVLGCVTFIGDLGFSLGMIGFVFVGYFSIPIKLLK